MDVKWDELGEALSGAVRPIIALMIAATICAGFLFFKLLTADQFMPVAGLVLGFIFAKRETEKSDAAIRNAVAFQERRGAPRE